MVECGSAEPGDRPRVRIGQEKPVTVYKLILKDTIEENLLKLQNAKLALAAQVVSEGMVSLGDLSRMTDGAV